MTSRTDWHPDGSCAASEDPDLWYAEGVEAVAAAKRICRQCPVRDMCLQDALTYREPYGVWGGLDEKERAALRQRLGLPAGPAAYSAPTVDQILGLVKRESLQRRQQRARLGRSA